MDSPSLREIPAGKGGLCGQDTPPPPQDYLGVHRCGRRWGCDRPRAHGSVCVCPLFLPLALPLLCPPLPPSLLLLHPRPAPALVPHIHTHPRKPHPTPQDQGCDVFRKFSALLVPNSGIDQCQGQSLLEECWDKGRDQGLRGESPQLCITKGCLANDSALEGGEKCEQRGTSCPRGQRGWRSL